MDRTSVSRVSACGDLIRTFNRHQRLRTLNMQVHAAAGRRRRGGRRGAAGVRAGGRVPDCRGGGGGGGAAGTAAPVRRCQGYASRTGSHDLHGRLPCSQLCLIQCCCLVPRAAPSRKGCWWKCSVWQLLDRKIRIQNTAAADALAAVSSPQGAGGAGNGATDGRCAAHERLQELLARP